MSPTPSSTAASLSSSSSSGPSSFKSLSRYSNISQHSTIPTASLDTSLAPSPGPQSPRARPSSGHASEPSTSSASSTRSHGRTLREIYTQWKTADDAAQRLPELDREREECSQLLATARKMLESLRTQGSKKPGIAKRKPSLMQIFSQKDKNDSSHHLPLQVPPDATADIVDAAVEVHELERQLHSLTNQVQMMRETAGTLDDCYLALKAALDNGPLPQWRFIQGDENAINRAEQSVLAREESYHHNTVTTEAFVRARAFIQSAHHHYVQAMDLTESVCSPKRGTWSSAMGDEQSKEQTYKEAGTWAERAQVCFNECTRVLAPHVDVLRRHEHEAFNQLKEAGLLQAISLYKLMYGGKSLSFGITQQVHLMLQKQSSVFAHLTNLAVGIQDGTKDCEDVQRVSHQARDAARRQAVALWMRGNDYRNS